MSHVQGTPVPADWPGLYSRVWDMQERKWGAVQWKSLEIDNAGNRYTKLYLSYDDGTTGTARDDTVSTGPAVRT